MTIIARSRLFALALLLISAATAQDHKNLRRNNNERHEVRRMLDTEVMYPAVATAIAVEGSDIVYELDIIGAQGNKVTFIVHDVEEMMELSSNEGLLQVNIDEQKTSELRSSNMREESYIIQAGSYNTVPNFTCYRNLESTYQLMSDIATQFPGLATVIDIGDSYLKANSTNGEEGSDVLVLKITKKENGVTNKAPFFAMFGIHAREMAPPELGMRFAEMLVQGYGVDADITALLDYTEIHLLLQANPDGRFVAENQQDLFRRKNMRPSNCSEGRFGVDLNRNFPFKWGGPGSSSDICSQTYRGMAPASEPEVEAIVKYVSGIFPGKDNPDLDEAYPKNAMGVFMDIHSYSELNLWPLSFENRISANNEELKALAIKYQHFNNYTLSGPNEPDFLYVASGVTADWAYATLGASGSILELGLAFYQDCGYFENQIVPQNLPVLLYGAKVARAPYSLPLGPDITSISQSSTTIPNSWSSFFIEVKASDDAYSSPTWSTAQQFVVSVNLYIDIHPDDASNPTGIAMNHKFTAGTVTASLRFCGTDLLQKLTGPLVGRHMLHIQAIDSSNSKGPVSSIFIDVCDPSDAACLSEYNPSKGTDCNPNPIGNSTIGMP